MDPSVPSLDLAGDVCQLAADLVDVPSVSGQEQLLADLVAAALSGQHHLSLDRDGNAVVARTQLGRPRRVLLAGHLDTVPTAQNLPGRLADGRLHGCGSSDMKSGLAVLLHLAATLRDPTSDVTYVLYDQEEVEAARNGLARLARNHPQWLVGDLAVLMEPTNGQVEAGCQGTLRVRADVTGRRAHSARAWLGDNAVHRLAPLLTRLAEYQPRSVEIDGCTYREGLSAVRVEGGVAGNVVPDQASVTVNFRFAPDRSEAEALEHVREVLTGFRLTLTDSSPGALPGLRAPAAADFVRAVGAIPVAKYGWTDVARFAAQGMPAVNFGPGDPNLAHTREESVDTALITRCAELMRRYLSAT